MSKQKGKLLQMPKPKEPEPEEMKIGIRIGRQVTRVEVKVYSEELREGELVEMPRSIVNP
jgi:hypothetical protein